MEWLGEQFANGRIIDIILVLVCLELLALALLPQLLDVSVPFKSAAATIAAGAMLLLALRLALTDADWKLIGLTLLAALALHVVDLYLRRIKAD